ncbi:uncharacterized protein [Spinacia oleracea]|uniref:Uncharacterized protein n=1 Tax=Spinacia oleracea TaxID=3562 RepID=A0ABM3R164_SPIOL|nr:uncharacterized protein LOC130464036 [Spinacia oleracea]
MVGIAAGVPGLDTVKAKAPWVTKIETNSPSIKIIPTDEQVRKILRSMPQDDRWRTKVTTLFETKDFTKFNIEQLADNDEEFQPTRQTVKGTAQQNQEVPVQEEHEEIQEDPALEETEAAPEPEELYTDQQGTQVTEGTEEIATTPAAQFQPRPWKHQSSHPMELIGETRENEDETRDGQTKVICN